MNLKRVLIPVAMIALCAAILLAYNRTGMALPSPTPPPAVSPSRSPTPPSRVTPTILPTTPPHGDIPPVGGPAPDFSLTSVRGETVSLQQHRGESSVVLLFYRTGG